MNLPMTMSEKINLQAKLGLIREHWSPKIVAQLNGQLVKLVKFKGSFDWHYHEQEDEMFLVIDGWFRLEFRDHALELTAGELAIVRRGIEHRPVASEEAHVLLFEPASTLNTGNVRSERTIDRPDWI